MTIPWMQNEDIGLSDKAVEDHRCRMEPFHSVLCRPWLESQILLVTGSQIFNYYDKIFKITFCFLIRMYNKIEHELYATGCECLNSIFSWSIGCRVLAVLCSKRRKKNTALCMLRCQCQLDDLVFTERESFQDSKLISLSFRRLSLAISTNLIVDFDFLTLNFNASCIIRCAF